MKEVSPLIAQRSILVLVFVIILLASLAEIIFEGFSLKPVVLLAVSIIIIAFLWLRPNQK